MTSFRRTIIASVVIGLAAEPLELQLHRRARADQPAAPDHRGGGRPLQPGARRTRARSSPSPRRARPIPERLQLLRAGPATSTRAAIFLLGAIAIVLPLDLHRAVDAADLHRGAGLRHLRHLADGAHRAGWVSCPWARWPSPASARSSPPAWWRGACRSGWPSWPPPSASAVLATVLGLSSLRVKGLYLAVVTFVFALAAQQYFFSLADPERGVLGRFGPPVRPRASSSHCPSRASAPTTTWSSSSWPWCSWSPAGSGTAGSGRSIMAVRDNENAAAAYTVRPAWEKIRAFAIAGALAGHGWRAARAAPTPTSRSPDPAASSSSTAR